MPALSNCNTKTYQTMKKILHFQLYVFLLFAISACKKTATEKAGDLLGSANNDGCDAVTCLTADDIGKKHNEIIHYADVNMKPDNLDDLSSVEQNEIEVVKAYFAANPVCEYVSEIVDESVKKNNAFYVQVKNDLGYFSTAESALRYVDQVRNNDLKKAFSSGIITEKEYAFIGRILDAITDIEKNGKTASYGDCAASLLEAWDREKFDVCKNEGYLSRATLKVMENSFKYWTGYTEKAMGIQALPLWVGLDAVGGLAGGLAAGIDSYWNTGSVNWKSVGAWTLGGAVGASIPGTRWFTRLFR